MRPTNTDTQEVEQHLVDPERKADLAALHAAVSEQVQAQTPLQEPDRGPQPPSAAALQMATMAVGIIRPLVAFAVPALRSAPDELWSPVPEGVAAVMDHYGASADWMQNPWARLGISLAPLAAYAAVESMKAKPKDEPKPAIDGPVQLPEGRPGPAPVTFGAPIAEAAP